MKLGGSLGMRTSSSVAAVLSGVPGVPPIAPSALNSPAKTDTTIDLAWTDNSLDEDVFKIERSLDGVAYSQVAIVPANQVTYTDTGLDESTLYYYRVRAFGNSANSTYSNVISITTNAGAGGTQLPVGSAVVGTSNEVA